MPLTPSYALPYPAGSDTPDIPRDIKALADAVARELANTVQAKSVIAGAGLTGGGTLAADRTINVGAGTGIAVATDAVTLDTAYTDARYINTAGDTMTGILSLISAAPTVPTHAAPKSYVDSRIWFGTQAQYDAIGTKDSTVLYIISG